MDLGGLVNWIALGLAISLFLSAGSLVRPANGERPLLVGFLVSALFGLYVAIIRIASLQAYTRSTFGIILCLWLAWKLWALWATALRTRHPLLYALRATWRLVFGYNPKARTHDEHEP